MSHRGNAVMTHNSMANNTVTYCVWVGNNRMTCSMQGIGMVSNGSDVGTKGFGLGGGSVLPLERLGHRLMGHLACSSEDLRSCRY